MGFLRRNWTRVEGKLIDQRYDKHVGGGSGESVSRHEYIVEVPGTDGAPVRLTFREYTIKVVHNEPGSTVPVLVNRKCTKAAFDLDDPRVGAGARSDAMRAAEDERFRKNLDPGN